MRAKGEFYFLSRAIKMATLWFKSYRRTQERICINFLAGINSRRRSALHKSITAQKWVLCFCVNTAPRSSQQLFALAARSALHFIARPLFLSEPRRRVRINNTKTCALRVKAAGGGDLFYYVFTLVLSARGTRRCENFSTSSCVIWEV